MNKDPQKHGWPIVPLGRVHCTNWDINVEFAVSMKVDSSSHHKNLHHNYEKDIDCYLR